MIGLRRDPEALHAGIGFIQCSPELGRNGAVVFRQEERHRAGVAPEIRDGIEPMPDQQRHGQHGIMHLRGMNEGIKRRDQDERLNKLRALSHRSARHASTYGLAQHPDALSSAACEFIQSLYGSRRHWLFPGLPRSIRIARILQYVDLSGVPMEERRVIGPMQRRSGIAVKKNDNLPGIACLGLPSDARALSVPPWNQPREICLRFQADRISPPRMKNQMILINVSCHQKNGEKNDEDNDPRNHATKEGHCRQAKGFPHFFHVENSTAGIESVSFR